MTCATRNYSPQLYNKEGQGGNEDKNHLLFSLASQQCTCEFDTVHPANKEG